MLRFPDADFHTPGGARVEGNGVEPHVRIARSQWGDADLAEALRILAVPAG